MNTEQLMNIKIENILEMFSIKIENILERYIIYLKDNFTEEYEDEEFDYVYVKNALLMTGRLLPIYKEDEDDVDRLDYFKKLVLDNFRRNDEYDNDIIDNIVEKYRGQSDVEYYAEDVYMLNEIDSEDEEEINYENWYINQRYMFLTNTGLYIGQILLSEEYQLNKVDFIKSIIDSLNNPVFLK